MVAPGGPCCPGSWGPVIMPATCGAGDAPFLVVSGGRPPEAQCPATSPGLGAQRDYCLKRRIVVSGIPAP